MTKQLNLVFFPTELVSLSQEVSHHPVLMELLKQHDALEWEMRLAHIASYCEVILDGVYDHDAILKLAVILKERLMAKRDKLIVISSDVASNTKQ